MSTNEFKTHANHAFTRFSRRPPGPVACVCADSSSSMAAASGGGPPSSSSSASPAAAGAAASASLSLPLATQPDMVLAWEKDSFYTKQIHQQLKVRF